MAITSFQLRQEYFEILFKGLPSQNPLFPPPLEHDVIYGRTNIDKLYLNVSFYFRPFRPSVKYAQLTFSIGEEYLNDVTAFQVNSESPDNNAITAEVIF